MNKCKKHPKFKGLKTPKYECVSCLSYYIQIKGRVPRAAIKPTRVIPSKKVYNRKKKDNI